MRFFELGDADGDGVADAFLAGSNPHNMVGRHVAVWTGNSDGSFTQRSHVAHATEKLTWGGMDIGRPGGAEQLDSIAAGNRFRQAMVFLNDGEGTLAEAKKSYFGPSPNGNIFISSYSTRMVDVLEDGRDELVLLYSVEGSTSEDGNYIGVAQLAEDGSNLETFESPLPTGSGRVVILDMNGDGHRDALVANGANSWLMAGDGAGFFYSDAIPTVLDESISWAGDRYPVVEDLDGDGREDLVIPAAGFGGRIAFNDGNGSFEVIDPVVLQGGKDVAVGDFDGDTERDVAFLTDGGIVVFPRTGPRSFGTGISIPTPEGAELLRGADLNGDGQTDLVVAGESHLWGIVSSN